MKRKFVSKNRNKQSRKRKAYIWINAEGNNKTEYLYFEKFNSKNYLIKTIKSKYTDPENMLKATISKIDKYIKTEGNTYDSNDRAFIFVDQDLQVIKEKQIIKVKERIRNNKNVELIVSNPCFEIWFLSHKLFSTKPFINSEAVKIQLKKYYKDYSENKSDMYELTIKDIDDAVENTKMLDKKLSSLGRIKYKYNCQPFSEVYKVIEYTQKLDHRI